MSRTRKSEMSGRRYLGVFLELDGGRASRKGAAQELLRCQTTDRNRRNRKTRYGQASPVRVVAERRGSGSIDHTAGKWTSSLLYQKEVCRILQD